MRLGPIRWQQRLRGRLDRGSAVPYTLLRGEFVIRYPDIPRQGPEPDGDTVKFKPVSPGLVETLPRRSGTSPDINSRGISVRLEAIDALETHFAETHQELTGGNDARGALLAHLRFTNITYSRTCRTRFSRPTRTAFPAMCSATASTLTGG